MSKNNRYATKIAHRRNGIIYHTSPFKEGQHNLPNYANDNVERTLAKFADKRGTSLSVFEKKDFKVIKHPVNPELLITPSLVADVHAWKQSWNINTKPANKKQVEFVNKHLNL